MHSRKIFTAVLTVVLVMIGSLPANAQAVRKMRNILFVKDKQQIMQSDLIDRETVDSLAPEYNSIPNLVYIKNGGSFSIKLESTFVKWEYAMPGVYVNNNIIENVTVTNSQDLWFKTSSGQDIRLSTYVHSYVVPSMDGIEIEGADNSKLPAGIEYVQITEDGDRFYTWRIRSESDLDREIVMNLHGMHPDIFLYDTFPTNQNPLNLDAIKKI